MLPVHPFTAQILTGKSVWSNLEKEFLMTLICILCLFQWLSCILCVFVLVICVTAGTCVWVHMFLCVYACVNSESFPHPSLEGLFLICVTYVFMSDCSGFGVYIMCTTCVYVFVFVCVCVHESMYSKTCGFALWLCSLRLQHNPSQWSVLPLSFVVFHDEILTDSYLIK